MDFMHGIIIPENIQNWIKFSNPHISTLSLNFHFRGRNRRGLTGQTLMGYAFRQYGRSLSKTFRTNLEGRLAEAFFSGSVVL